LLKIIKSINIILKKIMWGNTVAIHSVFNKKKTTKLNSQPAQYEKIKLTNTILKKKQKNHKKKERKNYVGKHCSNP
jgi:hypothetical protein